MQFGMPFLLEMPTVADAVRLCHALQLDFLELNASFPACQIDRLDAAGLRALAREHGVFYTIHLHEDCDPFTLERGVCKAWVDHVASAIRLAKMLDVPTLNMHLPKGVYVTLPERKVFIYQQYRAEFERNAREFLTMVDAEIGHSGIKLCWENTAGWLPHERETLDLLLASPHTGLTLDIGHCHGAQYMDEDYYQVHRDRLYHMHAHDATGKSDHQPLGEGEIDLRSRFALARDCKARVVLEVKTIAALTESVRRLQKFL